MNRQQHYEKAEDLLRQADKQSTGIASQVRSGELSPEQAHALLPALHVLIAQAQVHALLANAERGAVPPDWRG